MTRQSRNDMMSVGEFNLQPAHVKVGTDPHSNKFASPHNFHIYYSSRLMYSAHPYPIANQ